MADATTEGTVAAGSPQGDGLPQLNAGTYPSQLFWLLVTFGFLLIVLSRVTMPRIGSTIENRRHRITGDLDAAERLRKEATASLHAYEGALGAARGRASALADENRKRITDEIERLKTAANATSQAAMADAEGRIAATRSEALKHVGLAAGEAAADIVERLIGERISAADAARAIEAR